LYGYRIVLLDDVVKQQNGDSAGGKWARRYRSEEMMGREGSIGWLQERTTE
jgi:hypothetical protein